MTLYKLELDAFMRLIENKDTQDRIKHTLATGKAFSKLDYFFNLPIITKPSLLSNFVFIGNEIK